MKPEDNLLLRSLSSEDREAIVQRSQAVELPLRKSLFLPRGTPNFCVLPHQGFAAHQRFLAEMLGTQRTTVVMAAGAVQRSGIITSARGKLTILSREQLEAAACDCYPVAKRLYHGLYR